MLFFLKTWFIRLKRAPLLFCCHCEDPELVEGDAAIPGGAEKVKS